MSWHHGDPTRPRGAEAPAEGDGYNAGELSDGSRRESSDVWAAALNSRDTQGWNPDHNYARGQIDFDDGLRTPPSPGQEAIGNEMQLEPDALRSVQRQDAPIHSQAAAEKQLLRTNQQLRHTTTEETRILSPAVLSNTHIEGACEQPNQRQHMPVLTPASAGPQAKSLERVPRSSDGASQSSVWPPDPSALYDTDDIATIPACVRTAVLGFRQTPTCTPLALPGSHRSITFKYGVRVTFQFNGTPVLGWLCMASDACRRKCTFLQLHGGKTSSATKHLSDVHQIVSTKTILQTERKRSRDDEVNRILASALCRDDTKRLSLLLETIRIIYNNLPFRFGEYEESIIIRELVSKEEFKRAVNARNVTHALIELYASARNEMTGCIKDNRVGLFKCLTMVVDFWSSKIQREKFLGIRVYFVDAKFRFRSVLLGTRHFSPLYGERDQGIRLPFERWLRSILNDFGLSPSDFFGSTTDSGPDVKWMMKTGLGLDWEWCIPHMVNASTKMACGLTRKPFNPEMAELLNKMSQTVFDTVSNSTMGDLLPVLMIMLGQGNGTKLVGYKPHRFMGMAATMQRILEKWPALEAWYQERAAQAIRNRKVPQGFPLADCFQHLVQLLSILTPIVLVNKRAQAEDANQVQVLLSLYTVRLTALALDQPIRRYDTSPSQPVYIQPYQLTSVVSTTRKLLQKVFYNNFFRRYTDPEYITNGAYTFEMQLMLHPAVKHAGGPMDEVVEAVARTEGKIADEEVRSHVSKIRAVVVKRLKSLMRLVANGNEVHQPREEPVAASQADVFDDDIMAAFAVRQRPASHAPSRRCNPYDSVIDTELKRWQSDTNGLAVIPGAMINGKQAKPKLESVLEFWHRQFERNTYALLPLVARIVFAVPASSAQIERDFGNSGQLVTSLRASTSPQNIDMACFLHQNRSFVDICQCPKLSQSEVDDNLPSNIKINLEPETIERMEWGQMQQVFFSTSSPTAFASDEEEQKDN